MCVRVCSRGGTAEIIKFLAGNAGTVHVCQGKGDSFVFFFLIDLVNTGAWTVAATDDEGEQAVHSQAHHVETSTSCELSQNFAVTIFGVYTNL